MKTVSAASLFGDKAFDFVFVDADHTYEGVRADIDAWLPKVRPGGWLMGHDFNPRDFPGVVQAVNEKFGKPRTYSDHVWAVTV
jgi:predicted O-methyltransferase YrrM